MYYLNRLRLNLERAMATQDFDARKGAGLRDLGKEYERNMIVLVALRCCQLDLQEFWIVSNADGLQAFDDLILYTKSKEDDKSLIFVQLKHKENPEKSKYTTKNKKKVTKTCIYDTINVKTYKDSFDAIRLLLVNPFTRKFNKTKELLKSTGVKFEEMKFIFATNTEIKDDVELVSRSFREEKEPNILEILNTGDDNNVFQLTSSNTNSKINFLNQFYLFSEQISCLDNEFLKLLEMELMNFMKCYFKYSLEVTKQLVKTIEDWIVENGRRKLSKGIMLSKISHLIVSSLSQKSNPHLHYESMQAEKWQLWTEMIEKFQVVLITDPNLICQQFFLKSSSHIFVVCDEESDDALIKSLLMCKQVKIIILKASDKLKKFKDTLGRTNISVLYGFREISQESRQRLKNCSYIFQGRESTFNELEILCPRMQDLFTVDDILKLLLDKLRIGDCVSVVPKYYIPRSVPRITVNISIFFIPNTFFIVIDPDGHFDKFFFLNKTVNKNWTVLRDDSTVLEEITKNKLKKLNVHVLKLKQNFKMELLFEWMHSDSSDISEISYYIDKIPEDLEPIEHFLEHFNLEYKTKILVVANSGMGKTIFLQYLARKFASNTWVIFSVLNALDYSKVKDFKLFLHHYKNQLGEKERAIFEWHFAKKSVIILFDGFDEVASDYSSESLGIILGANAEGMKIIVTTREITRIELENQLNILSHTLQPFNEDQKFNFLSKYYLETCKKEVTQEFLEEKVKNFVTELLQKITLSTWDKDFTGIPLQCRMLAETFVHECAEYCSKGYIKVPANLNLLGLYERFIDSKFNIYWKEKEHLETNPKLYETLTEHFKKKFLDDHVNAAVELIFPEAKIHISDKFRQKIANAKDKYGLVTGLDDQNRAIFIHRTFAEYFTAMWFYNLVNKGMDTQLKTKLLKSLHRPEYCLVRDIFDRMVCRDCELHTAILNGDLEKADKIMEREGGKDPKKCGRTALHLLASRGAGHELSKFSDKVVERIGDDPFLSILVALLERYPWENEPDEILGWTPLNYAENGNAAGTIDRLLMYNAINRSDVMPGKTEKSYNFLKGFLHLKSSKMKDWHYDEILVMCAKYDYPHLASNVKTLKDLKVQTIQKLLTICINNDSQELAKLLIEATKFHSNRSLAKASIFEDSD